MAIKRDHAGRCDDGLIPRNKADEHWRAKCRELILKACDEMWTTYGSGSIDYPADFEAIADRLLGELDNG